MAKDPLNQSQTPSPEPSALSPEQLKLNHEHYLKRCFELAKLGESRTFPNPIVGCVIVHNGEIIAEGFHEYFGGPHAEVVAVEKALSCHCEPPKEASQSNSAQDWITTSPSAPRDDKFSPTEILSKSTIYISLEPCSHHGKTPPCTDLIIKHKFKRLVYAAHDPNPLVAGKGIAKIKEAGIEVTGPEELDPEIVREAKFVNRDFFKIIMSSRGARQSEAKTGDVVISSSEHEIATPPAEARNDKNPPYWLTLKIALSEDGSMIPEEKYISNFNARKDVHRLRSTHQLIITGINTVKIDNPRLDVRFSPEELKLQEIKDPDILILNSKQIFSDEEKSNLNIFKIKNRKIFQAQLEEDFVNLANIINEFSENKYQKIMVEAGPRLTQAFLQANLADELIVYSPSINIQETLAKFYNSDFELISLEEIPGQENEKNNLKAIFSCKK